MYDDELEDEDEDELDEDDNDCDEDEEDEDEEDEEDDYEGEFDPYHEDDGDEYYDDDTIYGLNRRSFLIAIWSAITLSLLRKFRPNVIQKVEERLRIQQEAILDAFAEHVYRGLDVQSTPLYDTIEFVGYKRFPIV